MKTLRIKFLSWRITLSELRIARQERKLKRVDDKLQALYDQSGEMAIKMFYLTGQVIDLEEE